MKTRNCLRLSIVSRISIGDNIVRIQLEKNSVLITCGEYKKRIDSFITETLDINGFRIDLIHFDNKSYIEFRTSFKKFSIDFDSYRLRGEKWIWTSIREISGFKEFVILYYYNDKTPSLIFMESFSENFEMNMSWNDHRTWLDSKLFDREYDKEKNDHIIRSVKLGFNYQYNRSGKLKKKKVIGEIKYCNCD